MKEISNNTAKIGLNISEERFNEIFKKNLPSKRYRKNEQLRNYIELTK